MTTELVVDDTAHPFLDQVLDRLGPSLLSVLCQPERRIRIGETVVFDAAEEIPSVPNGVLLLVGVNPDSDRLSTILTTAMSKSYSAVVVKARGTPMSAPSGYDLAILVAPDDMSWHHLDTMLSAAASATGSPESTYESASTGDLFALANAIASTVGGAVTIEDPSRKILAYSNVTGHQIDDVRQRAILGRQVPDRPHNVDEYALVNRNTGVVRFESPSEGHAARLAVAVRAGQEVLGSIWALDGIPPLRPGAEDLLADAARIAALHLLTARSRNDMERSHRAEILRTLLSSGPSGIAGAQVGINRDNPTRVIAFAQAERDVQPGLTTGRLVDLVNLYCQTWHHNSLCAALGGVVYGVLPVVSAHDAEARLTTVAQSVIDAARRSLKIELYAAIGPQAQRLDDVPAVRHLTDRVLDLLATTGSAGQVATAESLRSRIYLLDLVDSGIADESALLPELLEMIRQDAERGTTHAETLLAYLDTFGDVVSAAARMSVHDNTLRYRLRRIREMFRLDLDDPDVRLVVWLQLKLALPRVPGVVGTAE